MSILIVCKYKSMYEHKIDKYSSKLEITNDSQKRELYTHKIKKYSGGACGIIKSGIYIIFTVKEAIDIKDSLIDDQSNAFSVINYYFPGLVLKLNDNEMRVLECNFFKPRSFSNFCRVPGFTFSQTSAENLSMLYTYVTGFDADKAEKDFTNYFNKKNAEYDTIIKKITDMKAKLESEKKRRLDELTAVKKCKDRVTLLPQLKARQKNFNEQIKPFYVKGFLTTADAIKTEPMKTSTITECYTKMQHIKQHLQVAQPTVYANIKLEMDNFTCAIVIDGDKNKILSIYSIDNNQQTIYSAAIPTTVTSVAPTTVTSVVPTTVASVAPTTVASVAPRQ